MRNIEAKRAPARSARNRGAQQQSATPGLEKLIDNGAESKGIPSGKRARVRLIDSTMSTRRPLFADVVHSIV